MKKTLRRFFCENNNKKKIEMDPKPHIKLCVLIKKNNNKIKFVDGCY